MQSAQSILKKLKKLCSSLKKKRNSNIYTIRYDLDLELNDTFIDKSNTISQADWLQIMDEVYPLFENKKPLHQCLCGYFFSAFRDGNHYLNENNIINAVSALSKVSPLFAKEIRNLLVDFVGLKNNTSKSSLEVALEFIIKLNCSQIFKDQSQLITMVAKKATSNRYLAQSFLNIYDTHTSEKDKQFFIKKINNLLLKRKANISNACILAECLRSPVVKNLILNSNEEEVLKGLNKFIPLFSYRDYSVYKFDLFNFIKLANKNKSAIILSMQDRCIKFSLHQYSVYIPKILKVLELEGTSPKRALLQLSEARIDPSFLLNKFTELNNLMAMI